MAKFRVSVSYNFDATYEIEAEDEDEARELAIEMDATDAFYDSYLDSRVWDTKLLKGITKDRLEELAYEVGYEIKNEEAWMDYCDSVTHDSEVTEEQVRKELLEFKKNEEDNE